MQKPHTAGLVLCAVLVLLTSGCASPAQELPMVTTESTLDPSTNIAVVTLASSDILKLSEFYQTGVGLTELSRSDSTIVLGRVGTPIVELEQSSAPKPLPTDAGLYHTAILFSSQAELATTLQRMLTLYPNQYQGSANHAVSEAFYFLDTEGNGVEIYYDFPRSQWQWSNGHVTMGSVYINELQYISTHAAPVAGTVRLGHVHLKVGSISEAKAFYSDLLGFAITSEMPGALFVSAGGYHHHIGLNTWESAGAGNRPHQTGLASLTIATTSASIADAAQRLKAANVTFTQDAATLQVRDPWGSLIIMQSAE